MGIESRILVRAAGAACPSGRAVAPAHALIELEGNDRARPERATLLAIGSPDEVCAHAGVSGADVIDRPGGVLIPGIVNAHAHLDLTHIGPRPHDADDGFVAWVDAIRERRARTDADIAASVRRGIELSRAAGVVAVGDIAGAPDGTPSLVPWQVQSEQGLGGVSFVEFFAMGLREAAALERLESVLARGAALRSPGGSPRLGLQPHAPNTVSPNAYRSAVDLAGRFGLPLCTHLAETPEEREFISAASGPQRGLLEGVGAWTDQLLEVFGKGRHPVEHLSQVLGLASFLCVHLNDAPDEAIEILARTGAAVVYCPRASAYFEAERHFGPHRYRDLLAAGVPVCLGTDSLVCLPSEAARTPGEPGEGVGTGMGTLEEARFLAARDALDPVVALELCTRAGARALGLDPMAFTLLAERRGSHDLAGLNCVTGAASRAAGGSLHETVIRSAASCELLFAATRSDQTGN